MSLYHHPLAAWEALSLTQRLRLLELVTRRGGGSEQIHPLLRRGDAARLCGYSKAWLLAASRLSEPQAFLAQGWRAGASAPADLAKCARVPNASGFQLLLPAGYLDPRGIDRSRILADACMPAWQLLDELESLNLLPAEPTGISGSWRRGDGPVRIKFERDRPGLAAADFLHLLQGLPSGDLTNVVSVRYSGVDRLRLGLVCGEE